MTYRKKLIEVALPLDEINAQSSREKSIRHGHPSTLHLWWARRPLAACRAVLFASLVDDPSNDLPEDEATVERERLFEIIRELVKWENSSDEAVLGRARKEILRSTGGEPPPVLDPFCGGGAIPLEAQRLGLEAHGSDLNPVAVMITKALIELPPKFAGDPPVNPVSRKTADLSAWRGAQGLAEDVRHYGAWMREQAKQRIGHLYPTGPDGETVIAWLWARTVRCPNPACGATMPLVSSFWLSKKPNKKAWVEPVVVGGDEASDGRPSVRFVVKTGSPDAGASKQIDAGTGFMKDNGKKVKATFRCVACDGAPVKGDYICDEVGEGRNGGTEGGSPNGSGRVDPPAPPEPTADLSRTFRGVVEIDPMRLGGSAGAISQEVVQRLASIMGSNVRVTLEIQAGIPDGIPEKVERDVSENCNTLKFKEFDFRE